MPRIMVVAIYLYAHYLVKSQSFKDKINFLWLSGGKNSSWSW